MLTQMTLLCRTKMPKESIFKSIFLMNEKICIKYEDKKAVIICVQPFQSMKHICCAVKNPKELHIHFFLSLGYAQLIIKHKLACLLHLISVKSPHPCKQLPCSTKTKQVAGRHCECLCTVVYYFTTHP